jgi:hypothetical protein
VKFVRLQLSDKDVAHLEATCGVCLKKRTDECSHIECPNRRRPMSDPAKSGAFESIGENKYRRRGFNRE